MQKDLNFSEKEYSEIIEMALSDHIPFSTIRKLYGLREKEVKKIEKDNIDLDRFKSLLKLYDRADILNDIV